MPWKVGGNFEAVAICYGTNWRDCVKAVSNYFWSEVVSDVVDYVAKEELIWVLVAISFLILLYIKYRKITYSKNIVLDNQILSDMIHTLQDLELKVNVLTYKMQYGTLPLPHEIDNLSSKKLKKIRTTLSSPCDRKTWIKHMLLSEGTRAVNLTKKIKETTFCDEQTSINIEEVTRKREKSRENKDANGGYFRSNNVNVSTDANNTGAFSTYPILPTIRATRNAQSSRQILHQVKRKLHSLHNILRVYQHMNSPQSSEKSIDQIDEIDAFTFIEPEIKDNSKIVAEIRNVSSKVNLKEATRSSKMTNSWECCDRTSSSFSSIGYSSNASTKIAQRSVFEDDLSALRAVRARRHSSGAILQEEEDCEDKRGILARNTSNWSNRRSNSSYSSFVPFQVDKGTTKRQNSKARSNGRKKETAKRICYMLSAESFESAKVKTEASSSTGGEYDIGRFADDRGVSSRSSDLNQVSGSSDKEEADKGEGSTALLLQEALRFKRALLIRSRSVRNRRFAGETRYNSLRCDTRTRAATAPTSEPPPRPVATNVGNRDRIPHETASEYFSITDMLTISPRGYGCDTTDEGGSSVSFTKPTAQAVYDENVITIGIPIDVTSDTDDIQERPTSQTGETVSRNTRDRVESHSEGNNRVTIPSAPKLQDLILTHVNNIRDYVDKFLRSRNKTISTARRALHLCRGEGSVVLRRSLDEVSSIRGQLSVNPVVGLTNNSPSLLLINTRYEHSAVPPTLGDDEFCTDVRDTKGNASKVLVAFATPAQRTFNEGGTRWLETAGPERIETDDPLPPTIIARYRGESDSNIRDIQYVTQEDKMRQVMTGANVGQDGSNFISRDSWYIIDKNPVTSCESTSRHPVVKKCCSGEERAGGLTFFDKSEKRVLGRKSVTLFNPVASPLRRLLLGVRRPMPDVGSFLLNNNLSHDNAISANINRLQLKAKSETSLITAKSKGRNFSLKIPHSFSVRTENTSEHIRKPLRQSYTKLHNSMIKRITRSTSITSPLGTFTESLIPTSKNHLEASARRIKHSPTHVSSTSILWGEKLYTKDEMKRYLCAEKTAVNSITDPNVDQENSVKQSQKYLSDDAHASSKTTLEILPSEQGAQFRKTDRKHKMCDSSGSDTRIMKHVESAAPEGVIVISIIENNGLRKRNLIYKNGLWSEESLEEKEATAKPSIADTCTSISDLH